MMGANAFTLAGAFQPFHLLIDKNAKEYFFTYTFIGSAFHTSYDL